MCPVSFPYGMAATQRVRHYIDALQNSGHEVNIVIPAFPDWPGQKAAGSYQGSQYVCLETSRKKHLVGLLMMPFRQLRGCIHLWRWKKNGQNSLYIYDGINLDNLAIVVFARILKYKVILDLVEDYGLQVEKSSLARRLKLKSQLILERFLPGLIDGLIVISSYLNQRFAYVSTRGIPTILIPIAARITENPSKTENTQPWVTTFVYSGTFGYKDHVNGLIEAFERLAASYDNCQLLLSGKGSNRDNILKLVKSDRIKYVGYLDDQQFHEFLNNADVLCMTRNNSPYANAGFPFKLGEYLATGKPVIASNVGDVDQYLVHQEDAMLVEPENIDELAAAMKYVMDHPDQAEQIGKNGLEKCKQHFDASKNGLMLVKLIDELFEQDR